MSMARLIVESTRRGLGSQVCFDTRKEVADAEEIDKSD
jgi:hypothetical protein